MKIKADTTGFNLDITDSDKEFASKLSKHNLFGMLGDHFANWRWQNAIRILEKAKKIAAEKKVPLNTIPSKFLQQFIDASSLEEDDNLQTMWANLLLSKSQAGGVNILYINILKSLEPLEAELLQALYSQSNNSTETMFSFNAILQASSGMSSTELKVIIHKFYGFNVLRPPLMQGIGFGNSDGMFAPAIETIESFRFSELGLDFCSKCNGVQD